MTALTQDRSFDQFGSPDDVLPVLLSFPVEAATSIFAGALVGINAAGNAVPASANPALKIVGRCERQAINTSAAGFGAAGAIQVLVRQGAFFYNVNADSAITIASFGANLYASDDNTLSLLDGGGLRPYAGFLVSSGSGEAGINTVGVGQVACQLGMPNPYATNPELGVTAQQYRARAVATSALAAYTYVAGVITANANGALGAVFDGVTVAAGDVVFLPPGIAAALADQGAYTVTSLGGASAKFVLTRVDWLPDASVQKSGFQIKVGGEGTVYKNTTWQAMLAADTFTVGTTDAKFFPTQVSGQTVLVAGTFTISVPVLSTKSNVDLQRVVANTSTATTGGYCPTVAGASGITAGNLGTGAVVVQACVAAGTINAADVSTINWTVTNEA
jgi:hypothetical protein